LRVPEVCHSHIPRQSAHEGGKAINRKHRPPLTPPPQEIFLVLISGVGRDSSVNIATDYMLDGPGSNAGGDEILPPSRPALGPTQPPVEWVPGLSQG